MTEQALLDPQQKLLATCRARAALRGAVVVESRDDRGRPEWILSWHSLTKACASLDDLGRLLDRMEGRA